jgi:diadenosine tetraphosphate (Ap4A) HIT family hydrolase
VQERNPKIEAAMKSMQITLSDGLSQILETRASELGLELEEFLGKAISQNADKLMRPKEWMPREEWDARVRGDRCPDCAHLASGANPRGYGIADLAVSRLDLMHNQFVPGFCVLYCRKHVVEPYELGPEDRGSFFEDAMQAAKAIARVFNPIKMNYQILGNRGPHLHCILQPRFHGDSEPGWPIDPFKERVILAPEEYKERVLAIQKALGVIDT